MIRQTKTKPIRCSLNNCFLRNESSDRILMSTHLRKDYARQLINAEEKKSLKILFLKLKSDYRSKFANLGNWKEEA